MTAQFGKRAGKSVLVIEKETFGGQITFSPRLKTSPDLLPFRATNLPKSCGAGADPRSRHGNGRGFLRKDGEVKTVVTDGGDFEGKAVVIASGAKHRLLGVENEENSSETAFPFAPFATEPSQGAGRGRHRRRKLRPPGGGSAFRALQQGHGGAKSRFSHRRKDPCRPALFKRKRGNNHRRDGGRF